MRILTFFIVSLFFTVPAVQAQERQITPTQCFVAYYTADFNAQVLTTKAADSWGNIQVPTIIIKRGDIEQELGFASLIFAQSLAESSAYLFANELAFNNSTAINALVSRLALCDQAFGLSPAIVPISEPAKEMMRLQKKLDAVDTLDVFECQRAYTAGEAHQDAIKSTPVSSLWQNARQAYFGPRVVTLDAYADMANVYSNLPANEMTKPDSETWMGRIPTAISNQNPSEENLFWKQVAECDQLIEFAEPISPGPLMDPEVDHQECAATFTVLRELYRQDQTQASNFHERGLTAAQVEFLSGTVQQKDQQIFAQIATKAQQKHQAQFKSDGSPDYHKILETFITANHCERQYGMSPTVVPQQIRQAVRQ